MRFVILPLMITLGYIAYEHHDKIADQYNAAYPSDPVKAAALDRCAAKNPDFSRLDADDRQACYAGLTPVAMVASPSPSPQYPYNPSSLPGNDIRREQANDAYLQAAMIKAAATHPIVEVPTSYHPLHSATAHPSPAAH